MKKIAYILDIFPTISETFIINEILAARKAGTEIVIFARKKPKDSLQHTGVFKEFPDVRYFKDPYAITPLEWIKAHAILFLQNPVTYLQTLTFSLARRKQGLLWFFKIVGCYALQIQKKRPQHLHAHFASVAGEYAMLISKILRLPYTFTAHGWHDIFEYPPQDFRERALQAKKVITVSQYNKNYMAEKFAIPPEKIEVIHCGIKPELFSANGRSGNTQARILSIARLHPIKGVEYLIEACKILKEKNIPFLCHIIGDGELKEFLEDRIEQMGLHGTVVLEGAQPAEEVRRQLAASDIYVNSSLCEGLSVSIMEAMASALPVVASNVTGVAELIEDGVNGYLVEPKNAAALAGAIERCIRDPQKRAAMGRLSRKRVEEHFALETEVKKLTDVCSDA